jgi:MRG
MQPILPPPVTIRQALDAYVASKMGVFVVAAAADHQGSNSNNNALSTTHPEASPPVQGSPAPTTDAAAAKSGTTTETVSTLSSLSSPEIQDWRIMVDGIVQLFNESLPIRLLYDQEEIFQLEESLMSPSPPPQRSYADVYGCEHLLRLFVMLPEILGNDSNNNLTLQQSRPIVAKVNDLIRFLHKNHGLFFHQQNQKPTRPGGPSPAKKQKKMELLMDG